MTLAVEYVRCLFGSRGVVTCAIHEGKAARVPPLGLRHRLDAALRRFVTAVDTR